MANSTTYYAGRRCNPERGKVWIIGRDAETGELEAIEHDAMPPGRPYMVPDWWASVWGPFTTEDKDAIMRGRRRPEDYDMRRPLRVGSEHADVSEPVQPLQPSAYEGTELPPPRHTRGRVGQIFEPGRCECEYHTHFDRVAYTNIGADHPYNARIDLPATAVYRTEMGSFRVCSACATAGHMGLSAGPGRVQLPDERTLRRIGRAARRGFVYGLLHEGPGRRVEALFYLPLFLAKTLRHGQELRIYDPHCESHRRVGGCWKRVRVISRIKLWRREPGRIQFSVKWGLRVVLKITERDLLSHHVATEGPLEP